MIAVLLLLPAALSALPGEEFELALVAQAGTSSVGSVEARLAFDPALLAAERFSLAPGWIAVEEPGLAALDNRKGIVVETAGYPGGFSGTTTLGTLTFKAKHSGKAAIAVAGASRMLDAQNADRFGTARGSLVAIEGTSAAAPATPARKTATLAPIALTQAQAPTSTALAAAASALPSGFFSRAFSWFARHLHF